MIQRLQSLWLLVSSLLAFLSFKFPFYTGTKTNETGIVEKVIVDAGYSMFLILLTGLLVLAGVVIIFFYKNRKLQLRLCIAGMVLSLLLLFLYFSAGQKIDSTISLWCVFVFAIPVCYGFAARGIWKDEKLVKSLDRLR